VNDHKKVFFRIDSNDAVQRHDVARRLLAALQNERTREAVIIDDRRKSRLEGRRPLGRRLTPKERPR
jgi:hypothetical protein